MAGDIKICLPYKRITKQSTHLKKLSEWRAIEIASAIKDSQPSPVGNQEFRYLLSKVSLFPRDKHPIHLVF